MCACGNCIPPDERFEKLLDEYSKVKGALIPVLQKAQDIYGYLSEETIRKIAEALHMHPAQVYGVATFYTQFRLEPVGEHIIKVCHGTACHVAGAERITEAFAQELGIENGQTTPDGKFTLEVVACLGCCSLAPVVMIDKTTYGNLTPDDVKKILDEYRNRD